MEIRSLSVAFLHQRICMLQAAKAHILHCMHRNCSFKVLPRYTAGGDITSTDTGESLQPGRDVSGSAHLQAADCQGAHPACQRKK